MRLRLNVSLKNSGFLTQHLPIESLTSPFQQTSIVRSKQLLFKYVIVWF